MAHLTILAMGSPSNRGIGRWRLQSSDGKFERTAEEVKKNVDAVYPNADFKVLETHESSMIFSVRKGFDRAQRERLLQMLEG